MKTKQVVAILLVLASVILLLVVYGGGFLVTQPTGTPVNVTEADGSSYINSTVENNTIRVAVRNTRPIDGRVTVELTLLDSNRSQLGTPIVSTTDNLAPNETATVSFYPDQGILNNTERYRVALTSTDAL